MQTTQILLVALAFGITASCSDADGPNKVQTDQGRSAGKSENQSEGLALTTLTASVPILGAAATANLTAMNPATPSADDDTPTLDPDYPEDGVAAMGPPLAVAAPLPATDGADAVDPAVVAMLGANARAAVNVPNVMYCGGKFYCQNGLSSWSHGTFAVSPFLLKDTFKSKAACAATMPATLTWAATAIKEQTWVNIRQCQNGKPGKLGQAVNCQCCDYKDGVATNCK